MPVVVALIAMVASSCTAWAWGDNGFGQLGDGTIVDRSAPTPIDSLPQGDWVQIEGGFGHTCGIRTDQSLWCWGDNFYGQLGDGTTTDRLTTGAAQVPGAWLMVSVGALHTCAITTASDLMCWGANFDGRVGDGTTTHRSVPVDLSNFDETWLSVTAGDSHTCAMDDRDLRFCWGAGLAGQLGHGDVEQGHLAPVTAGPAFVNRVEAGDFHTCGLDESDALWCWGSDSDGQVGDGSPGGSNPQPAQIGVATDWERVSPGGAHTCGIRSPGTLWCWGLNDQGQLGDGSGTNRFVPTQVGTETDWTSVAAGTQHTCAGRANATLWCWGDNSYGQLGDGTTAARLSPVQVITGGSALSSPVSAGFGHTCAITASALWCWGANFEGQLGDGTTDSRSLATPIEPDWTDISAGGEQTCRIREDATLWCVGTATGDGTGDVSATYRQAGPDRDWKSVTSGGAHACARRTTGTLWCWGDNISGQLGVGTFVDEDSPVQVGTDSDWDQVSGGRLHTCAVKTTGTLWCWGKNSDGQLGDGSKSVRLSPEQVGFDSDWATVTAGADHTCAVKISGTLWCWGKNSDGQLGHATAGQDVLAPAQVLGDTDWWRLSAGGRHTCAIKSDRTMWCWGDNASGQLGDGTNADHIDPAQVGVLASWAHVTVGDGHTCAIGGLSRLWCWGENSSGQLGDGTTLDRSSPSQVGGSAIWFMADAGGAHTAGIVL